MGKPEKRKETEKTGSTPENKGARTGEIAVEEIEVSTPENKEAKTDKMAGAESAGIVTYADIVAESNTRDNESIPESNFTQKSRYDKTTGTKEGKSTGLLRDQLTVDILTIDGEPMKDQLSQRERLKIYELMKLDPSNYNGVSQGYSGHPTYTYRLKNHIDVSQFKDPNIKIHRLRKFVDGTKAKQVIECRIRGIFEDPRKQSRQESTFDPNVKWIKFEKTTYKLSGAQIKIWMEQFGEVLTEIEEETEVINVDSDLSDSDDEDDLLHLSEEFKASLPDREGTGTFKAKVRLQKNMPQYIPAFGQKVKIHYQGINKVCTNCYGTGHIKKFCNSDKEQWIGYVKRFMDKNDQIPIEIYGRWHAVVKREFTNPEENYWSGQKSGTNPNDTSRTQEENQKQMKAATKPSHEEQVAGVTEALQQIRHQEKAKEQRTKELADQGDEQFESAEDGEEGDQRKIESTADTSKLSEPLPEKKKIGRPRKNLKTNAN